MAELLIISVIVGWALWYAWKRLSKTAAGKKSCCEQSSSCAFKDFIEKEGKPQRPGCSAQERKKRLADREAEH